MATPTFPNNWEYGDDGCKTNTICECIPFYGEYLAEENLDVIFQEDETTCIILG